MCDKETREIKLSARAHEWGASVMTPFLVKKSGLRRMFFMKVFLLIILACIWFEVSYSIYQSIGGGNNSREVFQRSASVDMIWVTRRDRDSGEQTTWIKQSLPQRYVCLGCQLNNDQTLIDLWLLLLLETVIWYPCLRVCVPQIHVDLSSQFFEFLPESNRRPRDWQSRAPTNWASLTSSRVTLFERTCQSAWLDAAPIPLTRSERILGYQNTSFWWELSNQKNRQNPPEMLSPTRYYYHILKISRLTPQKKTGFLKPRFAQFELFMNSNEFGATERFREVVFVATIPKYRFNKTKQHTLVCSLPVW